MTYVKGGSNTAYTAESGKVTEISCVGFQSSLKLGCGCFADSPKRNGHHSFLTRRHWLPGRYAPTPILVSNVQ